MSSADSYEQEALRRRIRGTRVGRALIVASLPLVVLAVFAFDNLYWERLDLETAGWRSLTLAGWAVALLLTRPGLTTALQEEHGLTPTERSTRGRWLLLPLAFAFQWWVTEFTPGSILGVMVLLVLALGWGHLARDAAIASATLQGNDAG
jgi:hypothetical protein